MSKKPATLREPRRDSDEAPFLVIWETTQACDLACRHCRADARLHRDEEELTTSQGKHLMDQIKAFGAPYPLLVLTGGDPFKRPDLFELVAYAKSIGLSPSVSPSGTPLLNRESLSALKDAGAVAISLSIDGASAASHDAFRGVHGSFDCTLQGCRTAKELGLKLQINTTVGRHNLNELVELTELAAGLGVMTWSVFFLVPTGRAIEEHCLQPDECEQVMHFLADASKIMPIKATEGHHYKRILVQREQGLVPQGELYQKLTDALAQRLADGRVVARFSRTPMNINSAKGFVFISHRGEVCPSGFLPVSGGNVKGSSLRSIYRESFLFRGLRDEKALTGRCGACEFSTICGGSRSRAYAASGDPLGEDPLCAYQPAAKTG